MTVDPKHSTQLDKRYAVLQSSPSSEAASLRFYEAFCDANLNVLVKSDLTLQSYETSQGNIILAFDTEERVAEFVEQPSEFIKIPGRELVSQLKGTNTGIGLNLNVAPTSQIVTPEILDWISELLLADSVFRIDQAIGFTQPSQRFLTDTSAINDRLVNFAGYFEAAYLCGIIYEDASNADALFVIDCDPSIEADLFATIVETQKFIDGKQTDLAVKYISSDSPVLPEIRSQGFKFQTPKPPVVETYRPTAPGMDPDKPPKLR